MFLRPTIATRTASATPIGRSSKTVRTPDGPRQRILCHLGELNGSAQGRWRKTIEVFNEAGARHQLTLFPAGHAGAT